MTDDQDRPRREDSAEDGQPDQPDAGAFLGQGAELGQDTIRGGLQRDDERVAGEATQSSGPAQRGANPDEGWRDAPEGHREGRPADDDMVRRKG